MRYVPQHSSPRAVVDAGVAGVDGVLAAGGSGPGLPRSAHVTRQPAHPTRGTGRTGRTGDDSGLLQRSAPPPNMRGREAVRQCHHRHYHRHHHQASPAPPGTAQCVPQSARAFWAGDATRECIGMPCRPTIDVAMHARTLRRHADWPVDALGCGVHVPCQAVTSI